MKLLQEARYQKILSLPLQELKNLDDFRERLNAFSLCWNHCPDSQPELASLLWDILPPVEKWPKKDGEWVVIRLFLKLAREEGLPREDAMKLLEIAHKFLSEETLEQTDTILLVTFTWDLAALWYERGSKHSFIGALPDATFNNLLAILESRIQPKNHNPEKIAQLALAGLLDFLNKKKIETFPEMLNPIKGLRYLQKDAVDPTISHSFIVRLFALEGIGLRMPRYKVFTPERCSFLLEQSETFEEQGPALQALQSHIKQATRKKNTTRKAKNRAKSRRPVNPALERPKRR